MALAGAGAAAAVVAGILVLSSGPSAEPAAAEVLRQTAVAVAAADTTPESPPGPGQFPYGHGKTMELEGWVRGGGPVSMGAPLNGAHTPNAFLGLVPKDRESWISPEGVMRSREVVGTPQFLSSAEQSRWEQAGSPLPGSFDPSDQDTHSGWMGHMADTGGRLLEMRRGVLDFETPKMEGFSFPDVAGLPTDPRKLRLTVQNDQIPWPLEPPSAKPLDTEETIWTLWSILAVPIATSELRAATFNALAELPGIELESEAIDLLGRTGAALRYLDHETGIRAEYIFDPHTSQVLGERDVLVDPGTSSSTAGLPAGLAIRDSAALQSNVVDSTQETGDESRNAGPTATTGPVYRR